MPRAEKKKSDRQALQHTQAKPEISQVLNDTENNMLEVSQRTVENATYVTDDLSHAVIDYWDMWSNNIHHVINAGNIMARMMQSISSEMMNSYHNNIENLMDYSKKCIDCRTFSDMNKLQGDVARHAFHHHYGETKKVSGLILDGYRDALTPVKPSNPQDVACLMI